MAELIFLGRSFYLRMTDIPYLGSCGIVRLQNAHSNIVSTLAVIRESDHAHFLMSFRSDKVNALWH